MRKIIAFFARLCTKHFFLIITEYEFYQHVCGVYIWLYCNIACLKTKIPNPYLTCKLFQQQLGKKISISFYKVQRNNRRFYSLIKFEADVNRKITNYRNGGTYDEGLLFARKLATQFSIRTKSVYILDQKELWLFLLL